MRSTRGVSLPSSSGMSGVTDTPFKCTRVQHAFGVAIGDASRVVDDVRPAAVLPDHHHHVAGDVDQVPDLQLAQHGEPLLVIVVGGECDAIQCRAHALIARVSRQLHAEAAIDLGHEAAAVARIVGVAPAVALAEELEALADQVRVRQRQVVRGDVVSLLQQRRREVQRAVVGAHRQLDDVRRVRMLAVHRLVGGPSLSSGRRWPISSGSSETSGRSGVNTVRARAPVTTTYGSLCV